MSTNLTEPAYWDNFWRTPFGASASRLSYFYSQLSRKLMEYAPKGSSAIELGCGGSVWLPMLALHGVDSWGIDYSDTGVERAKQIASRWRAQTTVVRGDVFDPSSLPPAYFDLVYSMGLLEHFSDSAKYVDRLWDLTKPGGHVLTSVPNLGSKWGNLQKRLDRRVYDAHRIYSPAELDRAHTERGFRAVESAQFFGGIYPLSVDYTPVLARLPSVGARVVMGGIWLSQLLVSWSMAPLPQQLRNPPSLAGHILGVYQKPGGVTREVSARPS